MKRLVDISSFDVLDLTGRSEEFCNGVQWILEEIDKTEVSKEDFQKYVKEKYGMELSFKKSDNPDTVKSILYDSAHPYIELNITISTESYLKILSLERKAIGFPITEELYKAVRDGIRIGGVDEQKAEKEGFKETL